jgi:1-pyrroline-5-carboxylate dehydrogenase
MTFRITYSVLNADLTELHTQFEAALASVRASLGQRLTSGGEKNDGELLSDFNPARTSELLAQFHVTRDPAPALARAAKAQKDWAKRPWQQRCRLLRQAADLISEQRMRLAAIMVLETGKNRLEALGDVEEAADLFRYYAQQVEEANGFTRPLARLQPTEDTRDLLRPYGVFSVLAPFNFPLALAAGMSGAALVAGNTVVLKPSEETPWCAHELARIVREAGVPEGVLQVVYGRGPTLGEALVQHPLTSGIAFTGSSHVGRLIMQQSLGKPCLMEMGGKNPTIISAQADLDKAVEGSWRSAFGLSGQKCSALSRLYVHRSRFDEVRDALAAKARELRVGDPAEREVYMGPVINAAAVERYQRACVEAKRDGTIWAGGNGGDSGGHFVQPTLVSVPRGHRLAREELFLPFLVIEPFDTFDEALTLANDCDYGLTGGVFSNDSAEVERFMDECQAGILYANRKTGATTGAWPGVQSFCGWKNSGSTGKGGCGPYYVAQFMREQSQTRMG